METKYHIIRNKAELKKLIKACKTTGVASVDFETMVDLYILMTSFPLYYPYLFRLGLV